MRNFYKIKKKTYFRVIFPKENFSQKLWLAVVPTAFVCQRYRVYWTKNQKLFRHHQHAKIIQSISTIHQIRCEIHQRSRSFLTVSTQ